MPTLIACLSTGKGTWTEVIKIMQSQKWNKIFLITNNFGQEIFTAKQENVHLILVDAIQDVGSLTNQIKGQLKNNVKDFEVALNMVSGSGKEHMALLEAILELGMSFRLITVKNDQVETMGL